MYEELQQLKRQVEELTQKLENLSASQNVAFKGTLDDVQVERVLNADTSGTPTTNTLLRTVAVSVSVPFSIDVAIPDPSLLPATVTVTGTLTGTGDIEVLDYPERIKIDTWKGQRLAIPVYDATKIIYP